MMRRLLVVFAALWAMMFSAPTMAQETPEQFIERVSHDIMGEIHNNPKIADGDKDAIRQLVNEKMMPAVDFLRITRSAVGPTWRKATPEQRQELQELFREVLINVYSGALGMAKNQQFKLLPHGQNDGTEAIVRTAMTTPGKPDVNMIYRVRNIKNVGWRVVDVNVEGVWLVSNYRSQFGGVAANDGIEGLIAKLRERVNQSGK